MIAMPVTARGLGRQLGVESWEDYYASSSPESGPDSRTPSAVHARNGLEKGAADAGQLA
jgi:hypothetical protein